MRIKTLIKTSLYLGACVSIYFLSKQFCLSKTDGFTLCEITPQRTSEIEFATNTLPIEESKEVLTALDQPYIYHSFGAQTFVFISQDGKYVLKFCKQHLYTLPFWSKLPFTYMKKLRAHKLDKKKRDFTSYKLASEKLPDLSGVLLVHLSPTNSLPKSLLITDKIGITHTIDLDQYDFILQRKAEHVHASIDHYMHYGHPNLAKNCITSLVDLIAKSCERGITDRDASIHTNCGIIADQAIIIDIGRLGSSPTSLSREMFAERLSLITAPFKEWLLPRYPQLAEYLDQECEKAKNNYLLPLAI